MTIKYGAAGINALVDDMRTYGSDMHKQIEELDDAAVAFRASLSGDQAIAGFDTAHKKLQEELSDTLVKLDKLGIQVENSLQRAIETDGKIGDGFAAF